MFKSYKNVNESQIEIKEDGNTATINYNGIKFILCDDETLSVAIGLIHNTFKVSFEDVSIYDSNNRKLPLTTILKNQTKYKVEVKFRFRFKMIKMKGDNVQNIDYLSTINDAKIRLSMIYCDNDVEKVVIYDDNKTEITNPNLKLIDIPNFQKQIYCDIDANRGEQSLYCTQKFKSKFNPQCDKDKRSSSPSAKEFPKSHPKSTYPSFALSPLEDSPPSLKPAQKIQIIRDEKPDKKVPEPEPEVVESTRPSRRRVKIKGPSVTAIKEEKSKQSPVNKVPIKKQFSSDDEKTPNTHKDDDEDKKESNDELMINFVFSNDLEKKYYSFNKKLNPKTTIKEIIGMIKEKYKIEDQIKISYKYKNSFWEIDPTMNIDDIRDNIAEKGNNGKSENFLYIDIKKQTQKSKSDPVKKKDDIIRKSQNNSSIDDGSASPSTKIKVPKKPIAHKSNQNTDDDEKLQTSALAILNSTSSLDDEKSPKKQGKNTNTSEEGNNYVTYIYQTNRDEDMHEVELGPSATVLTLKQEISKEYEVENLADIKIIFSGNDLLNKIVLKDLNIGDNILYIYIDNRDLCSSEIEQLKKENDELRSQLKDVQFLFSFYIKSSNDENYFIDQNEEDRYHKVISKIGEGATSITYKVIDTRNETFLCKKVLKDDHNAFKNAQNMMKEFEILHKLKHPCICQAYWINTSEIVKDANIEIKEGMKEKTTVSIFLEFLDHKLSDLLKNGMNNTLKVRIVVEIVHAMNFLHKNGMIHRDLKIDNIMLNSVYETKVVDFCLARIHELFDSNYSFLNESMSKGVGTLAYMSPEMLNESDYDYKTDVYSFGIVLYFIFLGNLPKQSMKDKTNGKSIDLPSSSTSISNFCIDLIKRCLSFDPSKRPSFEDILTDIRKNNYMLASYIDQSAINIRDHELELFNKYKK